MALTGGGLLLLVLTLGGWLPSPTRAQHIWLLDPPARSLERSAPASQRLPERTCPTPASAQDVLSPLPAGVPFRVHWNDPDGVPVEMAKLELFTGDNGHLLARLDIALGRIGSNGTSSVQAQLPSGLRCPACVLRLSLELDERIQLLSCAQVRVRPLLDQPGNESPADCAGDGDCGGTGRGHCFGRQCFCRSGWLGDHCASESPRGQAAPAQTAKVHSVRFPGSGTELLWLSRPEENTLHLGLRFPVRETTAGPRWFMLGMQSRQSEARCQRAMAQWKQRNGPGAAEQGDEHAKAQAGVLLRLEQQEGENALGTTTERTAGRQSQSKRPTGLNIRKLGSADGANGTKAAGGERRGLAGGCGPNQRWEECPETRECEPSCDWTAFPESIPACPVKAEQCGQGRCVCAEGFVRLGNSRDECRPFSFCQAPEATSQQTNCAGNQTWEKCGPACEPSCANMYSSERPCGEACHSAGGCTCRDNFVRAPDGQCILWTDCPNLRERIGGVLNGTEEQERGASEEDSKGTAGEQLMAGESGIGSPAGECAANETLNECGRVCEADCVSIFEREECRECGSPACSCRQGFARDGGKCVYWGDCATVNLATVSAGTKSTLGPKEDVKEKSPSSATTPAGKTPSQATTSATADEPTLDLCRGRWTWPAGCSGEKCLYSLEWRAEERTDSIHFSLESRPAVAKKMPQNSPIWSGLGFSPSGTLLDADMVVLRAEGEGPVRPVDMHVDEELEILRTDRQQDFAGQGTFAGGVLRANLTRKRKTGDAEDLELGEEGNCFRLLFPVSGGRYEKSGNMSVPVADSLYASDAEICVRTCHGTEEKGSAEKTATAAAEGTSCEREFSWPEGCRAGECEYRANWAWQEADDSVQFNISARGIGRWTGIGWSRDGRMAGADIVTGWVFDQRPLLTDRFAFAQQLPAIDPADRQDLFQIGGSLEDDVQTISFRRKVVSPDRTTDLSLGQCLHFLFPVQGGRVLARSSKDFQQARTPIGFHDQQQPIVSSKKVCLCERPKEERNGRPGRKRRAAEKEEEEGAYQCADIALVQFAAEQQGDSLPMRVVDTFGLSNDSLFRDEVWGGRQSISGAELQRDGDQMTIWLRKELEDEGNPNGDWEVQGGPVPVFLASGEGTGPPDMGQAQRLEFAMVNLLEGGEEEQPKEGPVTGGSSSPPSSSSSADGPISTVPSRTQTQSNSVPPPAAISTPEPVAASSTTENEALMAKAVTEGGSQQPVESETTDSEGETTAAQTEGPTEVVPPDNREQQDEGEQEDRQTGGAGPTEVLPPRVAPSFQPGGGAGRVPVLPPAILMDENCFGGFAFPEGCLGSGQALCQYMLEWMVRPEEQRVQFRLGVRMPASSWTGVGFSADGAMANADALVVLLLPDGRVSVLDQFSPGYGRPAIDRVQNVLEVVQSPLVNGLWSVNFTRPLFTGDSREDADLRECQHFLFMQSANPLVPGGTELRKHSETPISSRNKICLGKCGQHPTGAIQPPAEIPPLDSAEPQPSEVEVESTERTSSGRTTEASTKGSTSATTEEGGTSTRAKEQEDADSGGTVRLAGTGGEGSGRRPAETAERTFNLALRLPNERWEPRLEDPQSEQFRQLADRLVQSLHSLIAARWPSLNLVKVHNFAEGSVMALLQARFNGTEEGIPGARELKEFLQESAAQGMAAELILDRQMLDVQEDGLQEEDKWGPLRELQAWLLAGLGLLLLLGTMSALLFCAFRSSRRRSQRTYPTKQGSLSPGGPSYQPGQYAHFPSCDKDSDTTTAKTSASNGGQPNGGGQQAQTARAQQQRAQQLKRIETPRGIGEATYREWFAKVASKDAASHYQEHLPPPHQQQQLDPPTPLMRHAPGGPAGMPLPSSPYLSYPNDPAYYTLNGEHRIVPPPPAYYHRY